MARVLLTSVSKAFDTTVAVKDFTVEVVDKELVSFLGPSGCGKTTTLRAIAGFETITGGEIAIGDAAVAAPARGIFVPPEQRQTGMVFQSYAVWPHMTVFDNVGYPLKIKRLERAALRRAVHEVLELVRLDGLEGRYPHQLSGGQQQRVALARALVMRPAVLLLDEPLANLDANLREQMRFEIKDLQRRTGVTIIYVTHDQGEAMALSDRIVVMHAGMIQQIGTPREIYERPANVFVASFIGLANFLPVDLVERRDGRATVALREGAPGHHVTADLPSDQHATEWLLSVRPEDVQLGQPDGAIATGTLVRRVYLGATNDYLVRLGQSEVRVIADKHQFIEEGQMVGLTFRRSVLFAAEEVPNLGAPSAAEGSGMGEVWTAEPVP